MVKVIGKIKIKESKVINLLKKISKGLHKVAEANIPVVSWMAEKGAISLDAVITTLLLAYIAFQFIINFVPQLEQDVSGANISNSFTANMVDMAVWVVPVIVIYLVYRGIMGKMGTGKG